MGWERSVKPGEPARVNLVVRKSDDPELYAWLMTLPYGKASSLVRSILGTAIREGTIQQLSMVSSEPASSNVKTSAELVSPSPAIMETRVPEQTESDQLAQGNKAAALFQDMKDQFK